MQMSHYVCMQRAYDRKMRLNFMSASTQTFYVDGLPPTLWRTNNCCWYNRILTYGSMCTVIYVSNFFRTLYILMDSVVKMVDKQDAQLLQRDRAAWLKVEDWNRETIFYGHIGLSSTTVA